MPLKHATDKSKLKFFLIFFLVPVVYNFVFTSSFSIWKVDEITYTYHIVDYSMGFCTKFLPGAIYNFFFNSFNELYMNIYETVLMLSVFAFTAIILTRIISDARSFEERRNLYILFLFFLTGPATFSIFIEEFAMLDVYWLYFAVIFFILISKRQLYIFIPFVFAACILVHFSFLVTYFCLFVMILFSKTVFDKRDGKTDFLLSIILTISIFTALIFALYFILKEKANLKYDLNGFNNELASRYNYKENREPYYIYYDYALYKFNEYYDNSAVLIHNTASNSIIYHAIEIINMMYRQLLLTFIGLKECIVMGMCVLTFILPVIILFYKFWICRIKGCKKFTEKFTFALPMIQLPFTFLWGIMMSPDFMRWLGHAVLIQFIYFIFVLYCDRQKTMDLLNSFMNKANMKQIFVYYVFYAATPVRTYC